MGCGGTAAVTFGGTGQAGPGLRVMSHVLIPHSSARARSTNRSPGAGRGREGGSGGGLHRALRPAPVQYHKQSPLQSTGEGSARTWRGVAGRGATATRAARRRCRREETKGNGTGTARGRGASSAQLSSAQLSSSPQQSRAEQSRAEQRRAARLQGSGLASGTSEMRLERAEQNTPAINPVPGIPHAPPGPAPPHHVPPRGANV